MDHRRAPSRRHLLCVGWLLLVLVVGAAVTQAADAPTIRPGDDLIEALDALRAAGLKILFSSDQIRPGMRVRVAPAPGDDLQTAVDTLLAPHGLVTREAPGGLLVVVAVAPAGVIRGSVVDHRTGKPVAGARVTLVDGGIEVQTDRRGRFRLEPVPAGDHAVEAGCAPYASVRLAPVPVVAGGVRRVRLELITAPGLEENVRVGANDPWPQRHGTAPTAVLDARTIDATPRGSQDVLRAIEPLPGVVGRDESAVLNLRGGVDDETLVLFDGLELYDPYHLKDYGRFVSIIDSRSVGSVGVHTEAFAAEYGGRMSGVIDVDSLEPESDSITSISVSTNDSHVLNGGTFAGDRGSWLVSLRGGYPGEAETLERHSIDSSYDTSFFDLFAKASYRLGPHATLAARFLRTLDDAEGPILDDTRDGERFVASSQDQYAWISLTNTWSPRLVSQTTLSFGDLERARNGSERGATVQDRRRTTMYGLKQSWTFARGRHLLKGGVDFKQLRASYDYRLTSTAYTGDATPSERDLATSPAGNEIGLFVADRMQLHRQVELELGLRWDRQSYVEAGSGDLSPRINLDWRPDDRNAFSFGWGHFYQAQRISQLQVEDGLVAFFPAQRTQHLSMRYEHLFGTRTRFRVSGYLKEASRLHPRFENLFNPLLAIPEASADRVRIDPERGHMRGAELQLSHDPPRGVGWWLGYSWASAFDDVADTEVRRAWDQRRTAAVGLSYRRPSWLVALTARYHSGRPTTPVTAAPTRLPDGSLTYSLIPGQRNSAELPDYTRIDLRLSRTFRVRGTALELYLNATNLLDADNACCIGAFDVLPHPDGTVDVVGQPIDPQGREVVAGLRWTF